MKRISILCSSLVVFSLVAGIQAGGDKTERPLDKDFLIKVATCNNAEIEISKLADHRAASSQVKDFAKTLIKDHQSAYDQLAGLLKNRKIGVVAGLEKETREEVARLGKLSGNDFDRAYVHCMMKEHKNAIAVFENEAKNGKEEDIRTYAKNVLPTLRSHLKKANELAKSVDK